MLEINFYAYKVNVKKQGKSAGRVERRSLHPERGAFLRLSGLMPAHFPGRLRLEL